jgi:hypothetical protein
MDQCLELWHKQKAAFVQSGSRCGKKGKLIDHFKIPKAHRHNHITQQIETLGAMKGFDQEQYETIHIDMVKDPYRHTNRRNFEAQIIKIIQRKESLSYFRRFSESKSILEYEPDNSDLESLSGFEVGDISAQDEGRFVSDVDSRLREWDSRATGTGKSLIEFMRFAVAREAHCRSMDTAKLKTYRGFQDFVSAIIRFFDHDLSGLENQHTRRYFVKSDLSQHLRKIDLWESCKILIPPPNEFYPPLSRTLHCRLTPITEGSVKYDANDFVWCCVFPNKKDFYQSKLNPIQCDKPAYVHLKDDLLTIA